MGNICFKDIDEGAWKQQNKELAENPAYSFANLAKGGRLIEAYDKDGPEAVEEIAKKEMSQFFYDPLKGEKHLIERKEFIRWQWQLSQKIKVKICSLLSFHFMIIF